jgi:hypothetical protein
MMSFDLPFKFFSPVFPSPLPCLYTILSSCTKLARILQHMVSRKFASLSRTVSGIYSNLHSPSYEIYLLYNKVNRSLPQHGSIGILDHRKYEVMVCKLFLWRQYSWDSQLLFSPAVLDSIISSGA